jgi:hypothetical protein
MWHSLLLTWKTAVGAFVTVKSIASRFSGVEKARIECTSNEEINERKCQSAERIGEAQLGIDGAHSASGARIRRATASQRRCPSILTAGIEAGYSVPVLADLAERLAHGIGQLPQQQSTPRLIGSDATADVEGAAIVSTDS